MNQIGWTDRRRTFTATETVRDQHALKELGDQGTALRDEAKASTNSK